MISNKQIENSVIPLHFIFSLIILIFFILVNFEISLNDLSVMADQNDEDNSPELFSATIILGSENPERPGHAMGYVRKNEEGYFGYSKYFVYLYNSEKNNYQGWVEFNLADLSNWADVNIESAKLKIHDHYSHFYEVIEFTILETTMYQDAAQDILQKIYHESGPSGITAGQYQMTDTDTKDRPIEINLNSAVIDKLNEKLSSTPKYYTFGFGMYIKSLQPDQSYARAHWTDIRLVLNFKYSTDEGRSEQVTGCIAVGDDLSGHVSKYNDTQAQIKPFGYIYQKKIDNSETRGYCQWKMDYIRNIFQGKKLTLANIKKIKLRFNFYSGECDDINLYHLQNDVTIVNGSRIFTDCTDGSHYFGPGSVSGEIREFEWDLGKYGIMYFQDAFKNKDFFGLGVVTNSTSGYSYIYSPKLVIIWDLDCTGTVEMPEEPETLDEKTPVENEPHEDIIENNLNDSNSNETLNITELVHDKLDQDENTTHMTNNTEENNVNDKEIIIIEIEPDTSSLTWLWVIILIIVIINLILFLIILKLKLKTQSNQTILSNPNMKESGSTQVIKGPKNTNGQV